MPIQGSWQALSYYYRLQWPTKWVWSAMAPYVKSLGQQHLPRTSLLWPLYQCLLPEPLCKGVSARNIHLVPLCQCHLLEALMQVVSAGTKHLSSAAMGHRGGVISHGPLCKESGQQHPLSSSQPEHPRQCSLLATLMQGVSASITSLETSLPWPLWQCPFPGASKQRVSKPSSAPLCYSHYANDTGNFFNKGPMRKVSASNAWLTPLCQNSHSVVLSWGSLTCSPPFVQSPLLLHLDERK